MARTLRVEDEDVRFLADCIYMASKEGYYGTQIPNAWDKGVQLCKLMEMSDEFIEGVERGI